MNLNIYKARFHAVCPADGERIGYSLAIGLPSMLRVEEINEFTATLKEGFHEALADTLFERFGGSQLMRAVHQGVEIMSLRGGEESEGLKASWVCEQVGRAAV